jgi:hypothetical protein
MDLHQPPVILVVKDGARMVSTFVASPEQCQIALNTLRKARQIRGLVRDAA